MKSGLQQGQGLVEDRQNGFWLLQHNIGEVAVVHILVTAEGGHVEHVVALLFLEAYSVGMVVILDGRSGFFWRPRTTQNERNGLLQDLCAHEIEQNGPSAFHE